MDSRLNVLEHEEPLTLEDLLTYYTLTDANFLQTIYFESSRLYTECTNALGYNHGWDKIANNLYLGKLPSFGQSKKIINLIKEDGYDLRLVVSVITRDQQVGIQVDSPLMWKDKKVPQHILIIPDFTAQASNKSIINTIIMMRDCIQSKNNETNKTNQAVLVHCKAGKGRSPMICLIYLYFYGPTELHLSKQLKDLDEDIQKIKNYLKIKRSQVEILPGQIEKAAEVIRIMSLRAEDSLTKSALFSPTQIISEEKSLSLPEIKTALKNKLASLEIKNKIIKLSSFIALSHYALSNQFSTFRKTMHDITYYFNNQDKQQDSPQKKAIKDFFMTIYYAQNENWYLDLVSEMGPMQQFADMTTYSYSLWSNDDDKKNRKLLRVDFVNELHDHLAKMLNCTVTDLKKATREMIEDRKQITFGFVRTNS